MERQAGEGEGRRADETLLSFSLNTNNDIFVHLNAKTRSDCEATIFIPMCTGSREASESDLGGLFGRCLGAEEPENAASFA